jgi:hypothetical protein
MPLWQIDVQKSYGTEYWTNVYHVDRADLAAARDSGDDIVAAERAVHTGDIAFVSMRISPFPIGTGEGTVFPLSLAGQAAAATFLPLFNVARYDMAVGVGRPSRKYLKLPVAEADQENGAWTGPARVRLNVEYSQRIVLVPGLCDVDGQPILTCALNPNVGMRQLRRGSKRKLLPVIPLG